MKAGYHLTEVKNVSFDSTDCGGQTDSWSETHMQLWEDPSPRSKSAAEKSEYLTTDKILSILDRVNDINPLRTQTELKFEYGNEDFNTGVMPVRGSRVTDTYLEILLFEQKADCKAKDACGTEEKNAVMTESCCEPSCCN